MDEQCTSLTPHSTGVAVDPSGCVLRSARLLALHKTETQAPLPHSFPINSWPALIHPPAPLHGSHALCILCTEYGWARPPSRDPRAPLTPALLTYHAVPVQHLHSPHKRRLQRPAHAPSRPRDSPLRNTLPVIQTRNHSTSARLAADQASCDAGTLKVPGAGAGPRWLWPEPDKSHNQPLEAYARPRLIQDRAQLWSSGQHMALLALAAARDHVVTPVPAHPAPLAPVTMDRTLATRLLHMAQQGRHTATIVQPRTCPAERSDLGSPAGQGATHSASHLSTQPTLHAPGSRTALRELGRGAAADVVGWHHENVMALSSQEPFLLVLLDVLQSYCTQDLGTVALGTLNASLLLPLSKGSAAQGADPWPSRLYSARSWVNWWFTSGANPCLSTLAPPICCIAAKREPPLRS